MKRIRAGLVGCGDVAHHTYLPNLAASPFVELACVCDMIKDRARTAAERFNVPAWFDSINEMLDCADFALLVNTTPAIHHASISLEGLRRGRHVFSEKPIATDLSQAARLLEEAARQRVSFTVAPNLVTSPVFRAFHKVVHSKEIGTIHAAYGRFAGGEREDKPIREPWYYQEGGGALFDLGVYLVTAFTALLGPAKGVIALSGTVVPTRRVGANNQAFQVSADDNTMILIDFGKNRFGAIQTGFSYGAYGYEATLEIVGTRGAVRLLGSDWPPRGIEVFNEQIAGWEKHIIDQQDYHWGNGASHMAHCLLKDCKGVITAGHAYHVLEIMVSAHESARTGQRVNMTSTFSYPLFPTES